MNELASIGTVTTELVSRALDAATLRHAALAANIANATTEGYRPLHVAFEEQLAAARHALLDRDEATARRALDNLHPQIVEATVEAQVRLDREVSLMMQNALRYQALVTSLSKNASLLRTAIREGRS